MVEKLGRRKLFLTSGIGMFCSFVLILGIAGGYDATKNTKLGVSMVPFIFVFMGFYSFGLTPLPMLYTPEIVPLALRAKAFTILAVTQNTSNTFNQ
jgi:MFS family permease